MSEDAFIRDVQRIAAGHAPPEFYVVWPRGNVVWTIGPLLGERVRITLGSAVNHDIGIYDEAWDYDDVELAMLELQKFVLQADGECTGEPQGWVRHIPSYRRRPGGDPAKEYVAP